MKKNVMVFVTVLMLTAGLYAGDGDRIGLSLATAPVLAVYNKADTALNQLGYGVQLSLNYTLPTFRYLGFRGQFDYTAISTEDDSNHSLLGMDAAVVGGLDLSDRFRLNLFGEGGYFLLLSSTADTEGRMLYGGGLGAVYRLNPGWDLTGDVSYRQALGLTGSVRVAIGAAYNFRKRGPVQFAPGGIQVVPYEGIELSDVVIEDIFPVFYTNYENESLGSGKLWNTGEEPIRNLRLTFMVNDYMENPVDVIRIEEIPPGGSIEFDIRSFFTESILEVTTRKKVQAHLLADFKVGSDSFRNDFTTTIAVEHRNAMRWDDDYRAAAFISATDPTVIHFAKNVRSMTKGQGSKALDDHFLAAISLHEALRLSRVRYTIDPSSSYEKLSLNTRAVDYLQYPSQTLDYRTGDCDDLTILYASLFEALGIETAYITTPGHIFMAFALKGGTPVAEAQFDPDEYIDIGDGKAWVPIEITSTEKSFMDAWRDGQINWYQNFNQGKAALIPTREAWASYPPVHLPQSETAVTLTLPYDYQVLTAYLQEVIDFIDLKISEKSPVIQEAIADAENRSDLTKAAQYMNKLGVLYARYGRYGEAEEQFKRTLSDTGEYGPALSNLGNIYYVTGRYDLAQSYYERALAVKPGNPGILVALVTTQRRMGNDREATRNYRELARISPETAATYSYLNQAESSAVRAGERTDVLPEELWLTE